MVCGEPLQLFNRVILKFLVSRLYAPYRETLLLFFFFSHFTVVRLRHTDLERQGYLLSTCYRPWWLPICTVFQTLINVVRLPTPASLCLPAPAITETSQKSLRRTYRWCSMTTSLLSIRHNNRVSRPNLKACVHHALTSHNMLFSLKVSVSG